MAPQAPCIKIAPNNKNRRNTSYLKRDFTASSKKDIRVSFNKKIRSVLSPGTYYSSASSLAVRFPTGERARSVSLAYVWGETFTPDKNGEIILAGIPFAECPFIRITRPAASTENEIESITAIQPKVFRDDKNLLKTKKIYGWRMNAQSMTVECVGTSLNWSGQVYAGSVPPSIDNKITINVNGGITGYARTLDHLPVTGNALSAVTRAYYSGKSADGVYIVNRHTDPSLPFTYRSNDQNKAYAGLWKPEVVDYTPTYLYAATDASAGVAVNTPEGSQIPVTASSCTDITMAIFTGLDASCSYRVKFISCMELMVKMGSDYVTMAQPIEPRSYNFLEALSRAEASTAIGEASTNSWGSFFEGLNKAWDFLTPVASAVAEALPGPQGMVAKQIAGINKKLNDTVKQVKNASLVQPVQFLPAITTTAPLPTTTSVQTAAQPTSQAVYNPAPRVRGRPRV